MPELKHYLGREQRLLSDLSTTLRYTKGGYSAAISRFDGQKEYQIKLSVWRQIVESIDYIRTYISENIDSVGTKPLEENISFLEKLLKVLDLEGTKKSIPIGTNIYDTIQWFKERFTFILEKKKEMQKPPEEFTFDVSSSSLDFQVKFKPDWEYKIKITPITQKDVYDLPNLLRHKTAMFLSNIGIYNIREFITGKYKLSPAQMEERGLSGDPRRNQYDFSRIGVSKSGSDYIIDLTEYSSELPRMLPMNVIRSKYTVR